ncbi:LETM1-related biofilm-associated protein [Croceivirga thetidis]|uniref:Letm1 RBD domain-containing protein n=1 Tax=Croceivirga thetidis TaxID=2721623 RepID=A0ABX1GS14_9FLAO|nr:LETM1-related biofilm-associated protein [Croceivirga thetidis]NKI32728.1 hypothetical protein [Croceivirga thetidis]
MNPSAAGWIKKFGHTLKKNPAYYTSYEELYAWLVESGFIYGIHLHIPDFVKSEHRLSEDEAAKINLLNALYHCYYFETNNTDFTKFIDVVFEYYNALDVGKISFLSKILSGKKTESQLEKLLDSRIYLNGNVFSKAFGNSLTNSLLFVDVLIFSTYLKGGGTIIKHAHLLEYVTINIAYHALNSKEANKNDEKLIQLLASSLTFVDQNQDNFDGSYQELLQSNFTKLERQYLLDIACLTVWEDKSIDYKESEFIFGIGKDLGINEENISKSLSNVGDFFALNFENIPYLKEQNLAQKYYEGMSKNVGKLILRNNKRLKKELAESKELVSLISKSASKDLSPEERKKIQNQLLDIFKTIPSLAIFLLPGGAVLLPIAVSLIPKLLPSAFDDNRVEEK